MLILNFDRQRREAAHERFRALYAGQYTWPRSLNSKYAARLYLQVFFYDSLDFFTGAAVDKTAAAPILMPSDEVDLYAECAHTFRNAYSRGTAP